MRDILCEGCKSTSCHPPELKYRGKTYTCPCTTCIVKVTCPKETTCEEYLKYGDFANSPKMKGIFFDE